MPAGCVEFAGGGLAGSPPGVAHSGSPARTTGSEPWRARSNELLPEVGVVGVNGELAVGVANWPTLGWSERTGVSSMTWSTNTAAPTERFASWNSSTPGSGEGNTTLSRPLS